MIRNPILPGFNPDPSICRVGKDYFIATSTFEWFPGVQIHHSKDLVNWTLVDRPLKRASQLDMRGNPDSCGVWAPCLSHADGLFWLVYTDVKRYDGNFKDAHNYIVTAGEIGSDWSEPVYANSSGFDPSLFHDDDGRKWFVNMRWNHRSEGTGGNPKHASFDGILLQEFDATAGRLVGPITNISHGSPHGLSEGPHIFKRDGWYYLTLAEGGTGYQHAVTMARSREISGPYEFDPAGHLIAVHDNPSAPLQRTGHGQMVETPDGQVYHTFLCGRPLPGGFCPMGRETGLAKCHWTDDGWLRLDGGSPIPPIEVAAPSAAAQPVRRGQVHRRFDGTALPAEFQWLRTPHPERLYSLTGSTLRLTGRESIGSWFEQSLVARRQEDFVFSAATELQFDPQSYQQAAGLVAYYNRHKFHFLAVTHEPTLGRCLHIMSCLGDWPECRLSFMADPVPLPAGSVTLRCETDHADLRFFWLRDGEWAQIGPVLDASLLSDEAGRGEHASFTGAFVGMAAFDVSGQGATADFDWFTYTPGGP